ncbi:MULTISPECIES: alpha/beta hydrolase [unclassified Sphingobium]|uniref:alpha/beta hydrolase n=1 Tax=unclassified Sphingobium TaxID=2611147 RepID=UPI00119AEBDA|nr:MULTISPECIES: alpha/beta fold hydrolase [unclassified Sphingobium]MBG6119987.1 pimeloyl-ACP methyl ester carboxylesterase [Sphingobium sp. JAI105]TWC99574.1 alpha-beta hydrolase superfamily lysophospholipase [Sphingobium sp. AEW010]TWD18989.1 alpha-beta hydrolase superfamily lysophospholipase [Sphingobium sp. AEW013]TWD21860.1 alpha-beta hydrolase superfamily lysophospholipase [Sphingobium sp. AEW001]
MVAGNMPSVRRITYDVDGQALSALVAAAEAPRAIVIALHGGGHDAQYWHHPLARGCSLLTLGATLGFEVVALDRPGNGESQAAFPEGLAFDRQIDLLFSLVDAHYRARGLPIFLIGHSLGAGLAAHAAIDPRGGIFAGIDVAGMPIRFVPMQLEMMGQRAAEARRAGHACLAPLTPSAMRLMFFGDEGSFDPNVVERDPVIHATPVVETEAAREIVEQAEALVRALDLPVQWTFAAQERSSLFDADILACVTEWLSANRHARVVLQPDSGHNISLHHVGRAYHLRALAFFEEMLARRLPR